MKKATVTILILSAIFFVFIWSVYYFFFLGDLNNKKEMRNISEMKMDLLRVRFALVNMAKLEVGDRAYEEMLEKNMTELRTYVDSNPVRGAITDKTILEQSILERAENIHQELLFIIAPLIVAYDTYGLLLTYNPEKDLVENYTDLGVEKISERLGNAYHGMLFLEGAMPTTDLENRLVLLTEGVKEIENNILEGYEVYEEVKLFSEDYAVFKSLLHEQLIREIKSPQGIEAIKELTNLMYEYDSMMGR